MVGEAGSTGVECYDTKHFSLFVEGDEGSYDSSTFSFTNLSIAYCYSPT